ncbi:hypothetical protein [Tropicimonas isoalkanivorans]|uniref:Glycosyl transferase family 2 n=1 Tax=Tropicimonas isoalkanivorans TaxID=441112 RepID=A0A1I1LKQ5_9RHOB|nr:hypothetical protein [Tropicimonas isoalkanivorans]SFC73142.1 hypothetical protein SAMN04488094_108154 [Tropicimonas isoalkanivorans]
MTEPRRIACLTMLRDEEFFFPIWYRYYASLFGPQNLFVIDHKSRRRPTAPETGHNLNIVTVPFEHALDKNRKPRKLDGSRFQLISRLAEGLLTYYDAVIFNDTDEIFVVDPARFANLKDFLNSPEGQAPVLAGMGLDVIQDPEEETPLDLTQPVLRQRRHFVYSPVWAKPHIIAEPCNIAPHGVSIPFRYHPDLYLVHLKNADLAEIMKRQAERQGAVDANTIAVNCTWRMTAEQKKSELASLLDLPQKFGELSHREMIKDDFDGKDGLLGGDDGPSRRRKAKFFPWAYKVREFLTPNTVSALQSHRYLLPARFQSASDFLETDASRD